MSNFTVTSTKYANYNMQYCLEFGLVLYVSIPENDQDKQYIKELVKLLIHYFYIRDYKYIYSIKSNDSHEIFQSEKYDILNNLDYYIFYETDDCLNLEGMLLTNQIMQSMAYEGGYSTHPNSIIIKKDEDGIALHFLVIENSFEEQILLDFFGENGIAIVYPSL